MKSLVNGFISRVLGFGCTMTQLLVVSDSSGGGESQQSPQSRVWYVVTNSKLSNPQPPNPCKNLLFSVLATNPLRNVNPRPCDPNPKPALQHVHARDSTYGSFRAISSCSSVGGLGMGTDLGFFV